MLTRTIGHRLSWPIERLAALLARTGIPPNVITWSALVMNLWAAVFFAAGRFRAGAGMMIVAGRGGRDAFLSSADSWNRFSTAMRT
jgi:hypothetical protein